MLVPKGKQEARDAAYSASSEYSARSEHLGASTDCFLEGVGAKGGCLGVNARPCRKTDRRRCRCWGSKRRAAPWYITKDT